MNNQKDLNPFKVNGTKEVWDRIQEQSKQNQPIKFPGIGIEQTPWFQMQKQQEIKNLSKKQDYLSSSSKGLTKQSSKKLDIIGMYYEIDKVKSYKSKMEILDPNNKNCILISIQKYFSISYRRHWRMQHFYGEEKMDQEIDQQIHLINQ
ncbi:hypothetical protein pb186bvf_002321 [Paramecium bursaria]